MSEHGDVREALELAAVEPGGLDRLEAGDTPGAAVVAGHLAGCPACLEELARLRRADTLLRPILAAEPDPALRERTLALVRAVGVPRGAAARRPSPPRRPRRVAARRGDRGRRVPRRRLATPAWIGAVAAALVIGLVGGACSSARGAPAGNADPATALAAVARETAALLAAGDARQVVAPRRRPARPAGRSCSRRRPAGSSSRRPAWPRRRPAPSTAAGSRSTGPGPARDDVVGRRRGVVEPATWRSRRTCRRASATGCRWSEAGASGPGTVVLAGAL